MNITPSPLKHYKTVEEYKASQEEGQDVTGGKERAAISQHTIQRLQKQLNDTYGHQAGDKVLIERRVVTLVSPFGDVPGAWVTRNGPEGLKYWNEYDMKDYKERVRK